MTRRIEFWAGIAFLCFGALTMAHVFSQAADNIRGTVRVLEQIEAGR